MSRASRKAITLGSIRDQLDSITEQLDRLEKLLRLLVPTEQRREQSEIVATNEPEYKPGATPVMRSPRATNAALKDLYHTPIRQLAPPTAKQHPTLGSL